MQIRKTIVGLRNSITKSPPEHHSRWLYLLLVISEHLLVSLYYICQGGVTGHVFGTLNTETVRLVVLTRRR